MLAVRIVHSLGRIDLDVDIEVGRGLTALVGASGSGKTSVLNAIAGFLRPSHGRVELDGDLLHDTARGVWTPPHQRRIGYVFQEPRLFPHLTVRHNLQYARWFGHGSGRRANLDDLVGLFDLAPLMGRRPARLSGGEKQRIALARALMAGPRLLLLDEPLSSVDVAKRREILPYLDRVRTDIGLPTIHVTHSWDEVAGRAERVIEMVEGRARDRVALPSA